METRSDRSLRLLRAAVEYAERARAMDVAVVEVQVVMRDTIGKVVYETTDPLMPRPAGSTHLQD
jgi:hypothetical protein